MTLTEFFERLLQKSAEIVIVVHEDPDLPDFAQDRPGDVHRDLARLLEAARLMDLTGSYGGKQVRLSWSNLVRLTKGTPLFDEFQGNDEVREMVKAFLGAEIKQGNPWDSNNR